MIIDAGIITLGIFLISQFTICVWWASRTTQILREIESDIKEMKSSVVSKATRLNSLEQRMVVVEARCKHFHTNGEMQNDRQSKIS